MALQTGARAPYFDLPGTDGRHYSLTTYADRAATIIVFTCNSCPEARLYDDRLIDIARDYYEADVAVVAINANDPVTCPVDSFAKMKLLAQEQGFNFPYLLDKDQQAARAYGASRTPEVFVVDAGGTIVYHGAIDDHPQNPVGPGTDYLMSALDELVAGRTISQPDTRPHGSPIVWAPEEPESST